MKKLTIASAAFVVMLGLLSVMIPTVTHAAGEGAMNWPSEARYVSVVQTANTLSLDWPSEARFAPVVQVADSMALNWPSESRFATAVDLAVAR